MLQFAFNKMD